MQEKKFWNSGVAALPAAAFALAAVFVGCESADSYEIRVKPGDATVSSASPAVALEASGWSDYQWTLSDASLGYLSASKGKSVVYTARSGTFEGGRQTVTVTAVGSGSGSGGSSTNSASAAGYTANAYITHKNEAAATNATSSASSASDGEGGSKNGGEGGEGGSGGSATDTTPSLAVELSEYAHPVTKAGESFWISVKSPDPNATYSWTSSAGAKTLSQKSGQVTLFTTPSNAKRGEVAIVTCSAKRDGYKGAKAQCVVQYDIPASTNTAKAVFSPK